MKKKKLKVHVGYQNKGYFTLISTLSIVVLYRGFVTKGIPWNVSIHTFLFFILYNIL